MSEPTMPNSCSGCPLYGKAKGFVLGCGDPTKAKYAIILEAPGRDEISFSLKPNPNRAFLSTGVECEREFEIRKRDYPEIDDRYLRLGVPVVGATGAALQFWIWPKLGIKREDCYIDNTIRCLAPKGKNGEAYPTGEDRKEAELRCRQYDRLDKYFGKGIDLFSSKEGKNDSVKSDQSLRVVQRDLSPVDIRGDMGTTTIPSTILLKSLSEQVATRASSEGVSSEGLYSLQSRLHTVLAREESPSNRGVEETPILQQVVCREDSDKREVFRLDGRGDNAGAVSSNLRSRSSKSEQQQVRVGAQTCDGESDGKVSQVHGSGASSERNKDGQSTRKLGDCQDSTLGSSRVSALRERIQYQVAIASLHPASILREITPLPLLVKDFEKLRDFTQQGHRCLMLLGGKSVHAFLRYGSNVTKWRGTYQALSPDWPETYKSDFEYTRKRKREPKVMVEGVCGKKHKGKKKAPSCGYVGCVEDFQRRTDADKVQP